MLLEWSSCVQLCAKTKYLNEVISWNCENKLQNLDPRIILSQIIIISKCLYFKSSAKGKSVLLVFFFFGQHKWCKRQHDILVPNEFLQRRGHAQGFLFQFCGFETLVVFFKKLKKLVKFIYIFKKTFSIFLVMNMTKFVHKKINWDPSAKDSLGRRSCCLNHNVP
jgi:hypothetical protein